MSRKKALENYTEVKDRIKWYKEDHPDFRIVTTVVSDRANTDSVIIKAFLYRNMEEQERGLPHATGLAEEMRGAGFINETSHVENCETSAIGRALANVDYAGSDKRPSKEEMKKVERTKKYNENKRSSENGSESVVQEAKSSTDNQQTKEEPKVEKTTGSSADIESTIESFDEAEALVDWFSEELSKRKGSEGAEFKQQYLPLVQERASALLAN